MAYLTGRALVAGIAGWPVAHSRSPRIHGFWLRRYGIDGAYVPLAIAPERFGRAIDGLGAAGFAGLNVTIPHKVAAFDCCEVVEESARRAGAVNTVAFHDGRARGSNTDIFGFLESLREAGVAPGAGPALVLGSGGAARAVVAALRSEGAPVSIAARTMPRAEVLARDLGPVRLLPWSAREAAVRDHALLVNATSLGMAGQAGLAISLERAAPALAVADLVYVPLETPLLAEARARGLRAVDGLGMLLHQARPGFAAWFGVDPAVDSALRDAVLADLASPA